MKTSKRETAAVLGTVAVLMAVFTFADLAITLAVVNPESLFGKALQTVGELPNQWMAVLSGMALMMFHEGQSMGKKIGATLLGGVVFLFGAMMAAVMPVGYAGASSKILMLFLFAVLTAGGAWLVSRVPQNKRLAVRRLAVMGAVLFLTLLLALNVLKLVWGRMRFWAMTDPAVQFMPWYTLHGPAAGNEYMSFPSGHSAQAAALLMLSVLPFAFEKLRGKEPLFKAIAYAWVALVGVSRVIMGAHFASDVTMGFLMTWLLFQLWKHVFFTGKQAAKTNVQTGKGEEYETL